MCIVKRLSLSSHDTKQSFQRSAIMYFNDYVRWAIYMIAKLALCQLNAATDVLLGITEYTYVKRETNKLIILVNRNLRKDNKFLEAANLITPSIMPSWVIDPDRLMTEYKNANSISKEERIAFLKPSMDDVYLIDTNHKTILEHHLQDIVNAYEIIRGSIKKVTTAGGYLIDATYEEINLPNQYKLAEDILKGNYNDRIALNMEQSMFMLSGAELRAKGLL